MNFEHVIAVRQTKTIYRTGDRCIKVFDGSYTGADVLNEAANQARIQETGLNVPQILEVAPVDGHWAITSQFISGKTLNKIMEERPERKMEYLELLVDLQLTVHSKTCPRLHTMRNVMDRKIMGTDLEATTRYALHSRLESMPKHRKLCHGDFQPANIIVTEDGVPYILDWSHATQGNGTADAVMTGFLLYLGGDMDGARTYLDLYCEKSGASRDYVKTWMPIVAAAQLSTAAAQAREFFLRVINSEHQKEGVGLI